MKVIVEWPEKENFDSSMLDAANKRDIFLHLLKREFGQPWQGRVIKRERSQIALKAPFIELRKQVGEANILLRIGYERKINRGWHSSEPKHPDEVVVLMSMNATSTFTADDFVELNLATNEGICAFEHFWKKHNGED